MRPNLIGSSSITSATRRAKRARAGWNGRDVGVHRGQVKEPQISCPTLSVGRFWGGQRGAQGFQAKVQLVEIRVQLRGLVLGGATALYGDAHDPRPEGQELLEGVGDLRV